MISSRGFAVAIKRGQKGFMFMSADPNPRGRLIARFWSGSLKLFFVAYRNDRASDISRGSRGGKHARTKELTVSLTVLIS